MTVQLKMSKAVQAKNFKLGDTGAGGHPNKIPFTCSLFAVNQPSDGSPHGAAGKLIRISSSACDQYLQTFEGMGVNIDFNDGMSNHNERFKVGVITKAFRSMDGFAMAEGYIFGKDFPDVVETIRYYNGLALDHDWPEYQFGTSIEMSAKVMQAPDNENVLDVLEFCGTGAAILFAAAAAFKTTSFAARNQTKEEDETMKPEELKAMQDAMKSVTEGMATLSASVQTIANDVGGLKNDVSTIKSAAAAQTEKTELQLAQERAEKAEQELALLKAAGTKQQEQRKTFDPTQLLSKYGSSAGSEDGAGDFSAFCASVDQLNLSASESMRLKLKAKAQFAKETE